MRALITDIKRFAIHDGDGIRTTIFFKGCPLNCAWCHNPETLSHKKQIAFYKNKCTTCGKCTHLCDAHMLIAEKHVLNYEKCTFCGKCEVLCPNDALKIYGKEMTTDEILEIVLKDQNFYATSGGGITLSGGECLLYPDFCSELLKKCKDNNIHTAVDTCGYISKDHLNKVIPYTDIFLYDLKAYDEEIHMKCTGVSNKLILENLKYLDSRSCQIEIRIPYVPEYNDSQIEKITDFLKDMTNVVKVRVLPYHNYAGSKYDAIGMRNCLPKVRIPTVEECTELEKIFPINV